MSHNFFDDGAPPPRRRRSLYIVLVILVIGGLLSSGIVAAIWFASRLPADGEVSSAEGEVPSTEGEVPSTERDVPSPAPPVPPGEDLGADGSFPTSEAAEAIPTSESTAIQEIVVSINRIAYIRPDGQVATLGAEGQDERLLTEDDAAYQFPAWSPDGQNLAVLGTDRRGQGIYLLTDSEEPVEDPRSLYFSQDEAPFYLYWSPDSRFISFLANRPGDTLGLYLVSRFPGNDVRLLADGSPFYWDWAGSSDEILVHTGFSGPASRLALLNTTGAGAEEEIAQAGYFQAPGVSASGRYLAYAEEFSPGLSALIIADRDTGMQHRQRHAGLVAMGWSPVGDQLAFISSAEPEDQFFGPLRLLDARSGETRLLSTAVVLAFFWSPDGRHLAVINAHTMNNDLNVLGYDLYPGRPLARLSKSLRFSQPGSEAGSQQPAPLQFDLSIIDVETGQDRYLYPFEPTRTFLSQFLPFFDQYALSHQVWSPKSDALVLPMRSDGFDTVFVVFANGDHPLRLAVGNMPFWSWQ